MNYSELATKLASVLVAAVGSMGFVTAVGGGILWTRFEGAQLPADQAVAATPKEELIVIGASALVVFLILGVVAVVAVHVLDSHGRASRMTRLGLIALIVVEIGIAIGIGDFDKWTTVLIVTAYVVAGLLAAQVAEGLVQIFKRQGRSRWAVPRPLLGAVVLLLLGVRELVAQEEWLAILTGVAVLLGLLNLGVARVTGDSFAFYGVSVFLSVILFGGVLSVVRTHETPKLQPIAVVTTDAQRAECGLYVTESDTRLYMARVEIELHKGKARVEARSGRIFWLPRDKVERSMLGPLQGVERAQVSAAELRDELRLDRPAPADPRTPTAVTPVDDNEVQLVRAANQCKPTPAATPLRQTPQRRLARQFQPRVVLDREDGFWPVSALSMFKLRERDDLTCRQVSADECEDTVRPNQLPWVGGVGEWLEFPGSHTDKDVQHRTMVRALGSPDPARTAREYFLTTGGEEKPTSLQYWFYYQFNYQNLDLNGVRVGRAGYHEGDFEMIGLLLSAGEQPRPQYVWMERHGKEGRPFLWGESQLQKTGDHVTVYAARGSHATYDSCAKQRRDQAPLGLIDDRPTCNDRRQLVLEPQVTPLSDLAFAPWACWGGRFGHSSRRKGNVVVADGPRSPFYQQDFGRRFAPCAKVPAAPMRPDLGEEVLSDEVGASLREGGATLEGLFDRCDDWTKRPPSGVYVVACDPVALSSFFKSGLRGDPPARVAVAGADGKEEPSGIPAVYRRPDAVDANGVSITAPQEPTTTQVYAVCYSGRRAVIARFPSVRLEPGRRLTLRTGRDAWTLDGGPVPIPAQLDTSAADARCRG